MNPHTGRDPHIIANYLRFESQKIETRVPFGGSVSSFRIQLPEKRYSKHKSKQASKQASEQALKRARISPLGGSVSNSVSSLRGTDAICCLLAGTPICSPFVVAWYCTIATGSCDDF